MKSTLLIASVTFQELIREKLFLVMVFISILFIFLSLALSNMTIFEYQRILADLGMSTMEISTLGIALFSGSYMLNKEFDKQTCLLLLSKPISRAHFLIGKFLGLSFLMLLNNVFLMTLLNIIFWEQKYILNSLFILINIFMKTTVVCSLVFLLSIFIRPILSLLFGLSFYLYGHWINNVEFFVKLMKDPKITEYYKILELMSPQFYRMNWKNFYYLKESVEVKELFFMIGYFSIWIILFLILAIKKFNKKDIV